jgi:chemotaxis protein MotA
METNIEVRGVGKAFIQVKNIWTAGLKQWSKERKNLIGLTICVGLFCAGFLIHGNMGVYFNLAALFIVMGGTFGAAMVCFPARRLEIVHAILKTSYRSKLKRPEEIVEILVDLSVKSRLKGLLTLEEDEGVTSIAFLRRALGLLVDGYKADDIRECLNTEMYYFKIRRDESIRVLRTLAEIAPSFGIVGSVVGLISLFSGMGETGVVLASIPIALISTLYGVVMANFFFLPFAAHIRERTNQELLLQKIITDGVLAIEKEVNPRVLEMKLKSFLTPSSRFPKLVSIERIRKKFNIKEKPARTAGVRKRSVLQS